LNLLKEIAQCIPQYMSRPDRPIKGMPDGWINERVSTTDWYEGIGEIFPGSTWAETSLLLSITELPGIYVDLEQKKAVAFDQLEVELLSVKGNQAKLRIKNPTKFVAQTTILVENKQQKSQPWTENIFFGKQKFMLKANETIVITLSTKQ
jgi:sRNA-binding carbon storage regulator CsrA